MTLTLPSTAAVGSKVYGVQVTTTGGSLFRSVSYSAIGNMAYGGWDVIGKIALNGSEGIAVPADRKLVCHMPIEPYTGTKFGVGGITAIEVVVAKALYGGGIYWVALTPPPRPSPPIRPSRSNPARCTAWNSTSNNPAICITPKGLPASCRQPFSVRPFVHENRRKPWTSFPQKAEQGKEPGRYSRKITIFAPN